MGLDYVDLLAKKKKDGLDGRLVCGFGVVVVCGGGMVGWY
jgi:hypothetical protein